jgi:DNA-binding winged helix-turn-helix (wHTH) protein/Tfp pilus assembly protein PilF
MNSLVKASYDFGPFCLNPNERLLRCAGQPVTLTAKDFDLLWLLVERAGHLLFKEELLSTLWPDCFIEEGNLARHVSRLRKALNHHAKADEYIETVARHGYRFNATVTVCVSENHVAPPVPPAPATASVNLTKPESLAVLPFQLLNGRDGDAYLGLGITDALITKLSNHPQVQVRPTSAMRKYSQATIDSVTVGGELKVEAVLEGSLQHYGDRMRVTVQLVSVRSGVPLWSSQFDDRSHDLFTIEDSFSNQIAHALCLWLTGAMPPLLHRRGTDNLDAYQAYLQGRFHLSARTEAELRRSCDYFTHAITLDPHYSQAYAGLGDTYNLLGAWSLLSPQEVHPQARAAALQACSLNDTSAEAHVALATSKLLFEWDLVSAEQEYQRAITLNPYYAAAHQWYALCLICQGKKGAALAEIDLTLELDPLSLIVTTFAGYIHYLAHDYDQADSLFQRVLQQDGNNLSTLWLAAGALVQQNKYQAAIATYQHALQLAGGSTMLTALLGYAYGAAGNRRAAQRILAELQTARLSRYVSACHVAAIYARLQQPEQAFVWLERALAERACTMVCLNVDPLFAELRTDPRFASFLPRLGLTNTSHANLNA